MRFTAAIFVAALSLGAVPVPEIVGTFNADHLRPGELPVPEGVTVTSTINSSYGLPVVRLNNTSPDPIWVPLFRLPAFKIEEGEIRYRMTFDTGVAANYVQPGLRMEYAHGESATTATAKNFSELKLAEPPLFRAEGNYRNEREDKTRSAVFGVMLYGPGVVDVEQAEIMILSEPFRGFSTVSLLLTCALTGILLIFGLGFMRLVTPSRGASSRPLPIKGALRCTFATIFVAGFFVLPQWESDWTVPFILCGAVGFLLTDLPFLRRSDGHV